jgi:hypothetical protein
MNRWIEVCTGDNITGHMLERGVFARCDIPPHTRLAPYLGVVCDAKTRDPYCLRVKDAENRTICLDARTQLYDVGYLSSLFPARRARSLAPPNYARYVNSLRPEQQKGDLAFYAIILPDPIEGFSWLTTGAVLIAEGTEILVDYGDAFELPCPPTNGALLPHSTTSIADPNPSTILIGKAFSSDNVGDGP